MNSCEFPKAKLNRVKDFLEYLTLLHFVFFNFKVKLFRWFSWPMWFYAFDYFYLIIVVDLLNNIILKN